MVKTNLGLVPLQDFLDLKAGQFGYDDYEEMQKDGYSLNISEEDIAIIGEDKYDEPGDIDDDMGFDPFMGCFTYDI